MEIKTQSIKPLRRVNNGGECAKYYMKVIASAEGHNAIAITKLTLSHDSIKNDQFAKVKKFKNWYLYREHMAFKMDTLLELAIAGKHIYNNLLAEFED